MLLREGVDGASLSLSSLATSADSSLVSQRYEVKSVEFSDFSVLELGTGPEREPGEETHLRVSRCRE